VTCPFSINNLSRSSPCEHYAESNKHAKYDSGFVRSNFDFAAMVFESTGGVNAEGSVLRLFRFAGEDAILRAGWEPQQPTFVKSPQEGTSFLSRKGLHVVTRTPALSARILSFMPTGSKSNLSVIDSTT